MRILNSRRNVRFNIAAILFTLCFCIAGFCLSTRISSAGSETSGAVKPDPTRGIPGKVKPTPKTKALSDAGGDLLFGQGGFGAFSLVKISRVGTNNDINYISEGREAAPIYAPDGNSILFQSFRDNDPSAPGPAELYTMDPNGFNSVRLTNDNTQKTAYCFSPDAQQIVFTESETMWKVSADGSGPASVLWTDPEGSTLDRPAYSPDGSKIFFVRDGWLWTINADGSNPQQFAGGINLNYFSISPDGSKIVYDNSSEIWSIGTDGSNETRILDDDDVHFALSEPKFSPDGTRILMSCTHANVCASKEDGSEFAQVTHNLEAEDFVWSPDSSRFGFIGRNAATNERAVYVGQVTGNTAPEIAYGPTGNFIQYLDWQLSCDGSAPTPTPTPTPVPPNGLISEWNANDFTANDAVGGNNGLASGDMGFVVNGKVGHAFGFSGADGIVTVPDSDPLDVQTGDYTLSTWFEPYISTEHYVAGKGACGENSSNFYIGVDPGFVPFIDVSHSAGGSHISNGVPISAFNWHHLLLRKSGPTFTFYIDGSQAFSFEENHPMNVGTQPFTIGRGDECTAPQLSANGAVDEVQLYGRALSDEEIGQLYNPPLIELSRNKKRSVATCQPRVDPDIELRQVALPVAAGRTSQIYIHLKDSPPVEGVNIDLSSSDTSLLTVPASVFFSQGETDKYVDYSTSIANIYNAVNVTATNGAASSKTTIIIAPASPDVAVSNLSAPATVSILQNFSATWTVTNHGEVTANPGPFDGRQDAVYISRDDQLFNDSTDRVVGRLYDYDPNTSQAIPLAPGQSRTVTLDNINIPSVSIPTDGTYYLFVYVGDAGTVRENNGNSSDNFMSVPIQVNRNLPDLVAENIVVPSEIEPNGFYTVTWDVKNAGSVAIPGGFNHDVYFSFDGVAGNSDDIQLTGRRDDAFAAGQTKGYSQGFIIPSLPARASSDAMIYVKVDSANEVFEDNPGSAAETNNTTTKGTRFEYRVPDLTVQSVTPPADVESDSQFALGWRTANAGNKDAGQFNEHVYFSTDNVASANDVQLGIFPIPGGLAAGQALDRIQNVSIPSNAVPATGDYFVYVKTDGDAQVDEGSNESNNVTLHSIHVRKLLRPDLQVTNITAPTSAFFGQEVQVQWTVSNTGQGPTNAPAWTDNLWLGVNTSFNGATFLTRSSNVSYLNNGESYIATATVRIPRGANGSFFLIIETDRNNAGGSDVNEENENNNITTKPITINIPPVPDLRVSNVQAPDQGFAGQPMLLSWAVSNTGTGAVPANEETWKDAVFLSRDNIFGADDRFVGTVDHAGALASGGSYAVTDASLNLPPDIFGPYYVFVKTDWADSVYEFTSEQNNAEYDQTEPGSPMTVVGTPPDLAVTTALSAPTAANAGQQIQVSFSVGNVGAFDATGAWTDGLYLSADQTFDPRDDTLVGSAPHNTLPAGQQYEAAINASLPGCLNGTYYLFAVTDVSSQVFEYDPKGNAETNNISAPKAIQLTNFSPDLQVTNMTVPPIVVEDSMPMSWTVKNFGNGAAEQTTWYDRVLIFTEGRIYDLGSFAHNGALPVGSEYTQDQVVHLPPELEGEFTITVRTDAYNAVPECAFNENNDGGRQTDIQANLPDLRASGVNSPTSAVLGGTFNVTWTGQNSGSAFGTQRSWADTVYLSSNPTLSGAQPIGGAIFSANLASGTNYGGQASVTIPNVSIGNYYLIVNADNGNNIQEGSHETNNASIAVPISITTPEVDLFPSNIVVNPTLFSGQTSSITWTVSNLGTSPTTGSQWTDYIVLSRDSIFDAGDSFLGYSVHNGDLAAGANYSQTAQISIPQGVTGDYRIILVTDRGNNITENDESNNVAASASVSLQLPAPSELNITNITAPSSVTLGDPATFTWTVQNSSSNAVTGTWQDSIYLSTDSTWDSSDIFIGTKQRSSTLAPFATYTESLDIVIPPVETGNYHVIARTDARNSIRETDETNNVAASFSTTNVGIQNLTLGVALNTTLTNGQDKYFSIIDTPADETILVSLTGGTGSRNELYSRYGSIVSRSAYEFQGNNQGSPNQENVVPNTTAGTYYTMARGDFVPASFATQLKAADDAKAKALADAEAVILKAELLPFSIRSVSPAEAGNKGYSFLNVDGAKFKNGASIKLVGPGGVQLAPLNTIFGDQSNVKALFDLNGKTAGDYQAVITNPNGQSASWGSSFHIRSGGGHQVRSEIAGAGEVSRNRFYRYTVTTRNDGLNDAVGVPIIVILSQPLTYRLSTSNQVQITTDGVDQSTVPAHVDVDGRRYIFLYAPVVRSHESVNIGIDVQFGGGADITATSLPPIFDPISNHSAFRLSDDNPNSPGDLINCYINLLIKGLLTAFSEVFPSDCAGAVAANVTGLFETMFGNIRAGFDVYSTMGSVLQAAVNTAVGCAKNLAKYIPWVKVLSLLYDLYSLSQIALECVKRTFETVFHVNLSRSIDPNEMLSPVGFGPERWLPKTAPILYRINFENKADATAPAQRIRVVDQLPPTLDPRTVRLVEMGFKQTKIEIPANRAFFQTRLQLGEDLNNLKADISAGLDVTTGTVTWNFSALDPATNELPLNPQLGLLPPDNAAGDGDGYVEFTVQPKSGQQTRTDLQNTATIFFDDNEPIATNTTTNLLDADLPTSGCSALPATSDTPSINLSWSGSDDPTGSGLGTFDIFVSENGGPFTPFITNTTDLNTVFNGKHGRSYQFYSVAHDNAGNIESSPEVPDASISVLGGAFEGDVAPRPNGNNDGTLSVADVTQVRRFVAGLDTPELYNEFQRTDTSPIATGGDGILSIADVIQERRYAAGLDRVADAFGPLATGSFAPKSIAGQSSQLLPRDISPRFVLRNGNKVTVALDLQAQGDEVGAGLTLQFDPSVLSNPVIGSGAAGVSITSNLAQSSQGKIGLIFDKDPAQPLPAGPIRLVTIDFDVAASNPSSTQFSFGDSPVRREIVNGSAAALSSTFTDQTVSLLGPTAARVSVGGRIADRSGSPIPRVVVLITDAGGAQRQAVTNSFGIYRFDDVSVGGLYVISVQNRKYRFDPASRTVNLLDGLTNLDFSAESP